MSERPNGIEKVAAIGALLLARVELDKGEMVFCAHRLEGHNTSARSSATKGSTK
jgi:hypothetical protein